MIRVDPELHRRARLLSVQRGESLNAVLARLLERWVDLYEGAKNEQGN